MNTPVQKLPEPMKPLKYTLIGQPNSSGIGTHTANFWQHFGQVSGLNTVLDFVDYSDIPALEKAMLASKPEDINISFTGTQLQGYFRGCNINWTVFESTRIPSFQMPMMRSHDIWVPTQWGKDIAIQNGIDPKRIWVVPEGVDGNIFHPYLMPRLPRPFRFLIVGKYEVRKGYDELLKAFAAEFGNDSAVELVIKSDFFKDPEAHRAELEAAIAATGCDNIRLIWGYQSTFEISNLYRTADVFVFPTRAEGWGLPLIEAAAVGLPIITTFYSGHTEFLQHIKSSCLFIDYEIKPNDSKEYQAFYPEADGDYGVWAVPDAGHLQQLMRKSYNDFATLKIAALNNSAIIRKDFSWNNSVVCALEALRNRRVA
jgi:glycosyltransferase involved in cell wall biosynthesis